STLPQGLETALVLSQDDERAQVLEALAPQLTGPLLQQALEAVLALPLVDYSLFKRHQARALVVMVPQLPPEQRASTLQRALETALAVGWDDGRGQVLADLAPQLPPEQRDSALRQALADTFSAYAYSLAGHMFSGG